LLAKRAFFLLKSALAKATLDLTSRVHLQDKKINKFHSIVLLARPLKSQPAKAKKY